jgi:hypothetical protein
MKKILIALTVMLSISLTMTGCFEKSKSENEKIKETIKKGFDRLKKNDISLLIKSKEDIKENVTNITLYTKCMSINNKKVVNELEKLNNENQKMAQDIQQLQGIIPKEESEKFNKIIKPLKNDKKTFQKALTEYEKVVRKANDKNGKKITEELLYIMFNGATKDAGDIKQYYQGIMMNVAVNKVLIPLSKKFKDESIACIKEVLNMSDYKTIGEPIIKEGKAQVEVILENDKKITFYLKQDKKGNWEIINNPKIKK